jgi:hypothetical protein
MDHLELNIGIHTCYIPFKQVQAIRIVFDKRKQVWQTQLFALSGWFTVFEDKGKDEVIIKTTEYKAMLGFGGSYKCEAISD